MQEVLEIKQWTPQPPAKRRMWVYPSERSFLRHMSYSLSQQPMREAAIAAVGLTGEQFKLMQPWYRRLFDADFWNSRFGDASSQELCPYVSGNPLGSYEAAIANLRKAVRSGSEYFVPIRIFVTCG